MDETAKLTGDVVLLGNRDGEWYVLLIERGHYPFEGCLALPGGHVGVGETTEEAAARELFEEAGLPAGELTLIGVYGDPGRDPRGRYVTWAYLGLEEGLPKPSVGDDACSARWVRLPDALQSPNTLAFDHHGILAEASQMVGSLKRGGN